MRIGSRQNVDGQQYRLKRQELLTRARQKDEATDLNQFGVRVRRPNRREKAQELPGLRRQKKQPSERY